MHQFACSFNRNVALWLLCCACMCALQHYHFPMKHVSSFGLGYRPHAYAQTCAILDAGYSIGQADTVKTDLYVLWLQNVHQLITLCLYWHVFQGYFQKPSTRTRARLCSKYHGVYDNRSWTQEACVCVLQYGIGQADTVKPYVYAPCTSKCAPTHYTVFIPTCLSRVLSKDTDNNSCTAMVQVYGVYDNRSWTPEGCALVFVFVDSRQQRGSCEGTELVVSRSGRVGRRPSKGVCRSIRGGESKDVIRLLSCLLCIRILQVECRRRFKRNW